MLRYLNALLNVYIVLVWFIYKFNVAQQQYELDFKLNLNLFLIKYKYSHNIKALVEFSDHTIPYMVWTKPNTVCVD